MKNRIIIVALLLSMVNVQWSTASGPQHVGPGVMPVSVSNGVDSSVPLSFSWKIHTDGRDCRQKAFQILVTKDGHTVWDSGRRTSDVSLHAAYGGKSLEASTEYGWRVRIWTADGKVSPWSRESRFVTGLSEDRDWHGATWIALEKDKPEWTLVPAVHALEERQEGKNKVFGMYKLPKLRRQWTVGVGLKRATAFVCGLGHCEWTINGRQVSHDFLDPGWTLYSKEALYVTQDVTHYLHEGNNEILALLGNGFYNIPRTGYYKIVGSFGAPKLRMMIRADYADGRSEYLVTDGQWEAAEGPITRSSIYSGEDYDATRENEPWQPVVVTHYGGRLKTQQCPPLSVRQEITVKRTFRDRRGGWVYDLGQNASGTLRVTLRGQRGQKVVFTPAELLDRDSCVNQSASGSPYYFSYTLKGGGREEWRPRFSYYGFRYVSLKGAVPAGEANPDSLPVVESLRGLHTCSSAPEAGTFTCSSPLFNQTYELIDWAIRSNMASVLTDCPHREKLGWLEESHLMQSSIMYRYDVSSLYRKTLDDMETSQLPSGCVPTIAPCYTHFTGGFYDSPEWGSAFVIANWYAYQWYGDKSLLERHYAAMKKWVSYLGTRADQNGIVAYGLGDWFDIGPNGLGESQLTSNGVTATAMYYYTADILGKAATVLGRSDETKQYATLSAKIREDFNRRYLHSEGYYDRDSQAANAIGLFFGLVPDSAKASVLSHLVGDIRRRGNALTAGDVGYRYVVQALRMNGLDQVIYDMNSRYDVPGYGWQLAHGATALTESWQAYGYVSNNHFMLGHLMEWFFNGLGGISQTSSSVGWREVCIHPSLVEGVNSARTSLQSPYGEIVCQWKRTESNYTLEVEIPANSRAIIYLPAHDAGQVTDYGRTLQDDPGVHAIGRQGDDMTVRVGSGHYLFEVSYENLK